MKYLPLLFLTNLCLASDYDLAIQKAGEAAYIQSGAQRVVKSVEEYGIRKAKKVGIERELFLGLFLYKTYRTQTITIPMSNNKRLHLRLNSVTIEVSL